jgi:hypothetical protein
LGNGGGSEERKEKRKNGNSKPTGRLKKRKKISNLIHILCV